MKTSPKKKKRKTATRKKIPTPLLLALATTKKKLLLPLTTKRSERKTPPLTTKRALPEEKDTPPPRAPPAAPPPPPCPSGPPKASRLPTSLHPPLLLRKRTTSPRRPEPPPALPVRLSTRQLQRMAHVPLPLVVSTPEVLAAVLAAGFAASRSSAEKGEGGAAATGTAAAPSTAARDAAKAKAKAAAAIPIPGVKRVSSPWATPALAAVDTPTAEQPLPERPAPASGVFQGRPTPMASPVMLRGRRTRNGGRRGEEEEEGEEGGEDDQEKEVVGGRRQLRRRPKSGSKGAAAASSRLGRSRRRAPLGEAEQNAPDDDDDGDEDGPWTQQRVWDSGFVKEETARGGAPGSARRPPSDGGDENRSIGGGDGSGCGAAAAPQKQKSNLGPARSLSATAAAAAAAAAAATAAAPGEERRGCSSQQRQQLSLLPHDNSQIDESFTPVPALAAPRAPGVSAAQAVLLRRSLGGGGERVGAGPGAGAGAAARAAAAATAARPLPLHALPPASFKPPSLPAGSLPVAVKPPSRAPSGLLHFGGNGEPLASSCLGAGAADAAPAAARLPSPPPSDGKVILALTSVGDDVASLARAAVKALGGGATISSAFGSKEAFSSGRSSRSGDGGQRDGSSPPPPRPPTHVVVGADRRTLKVLLAIAAGSYLVTPAWLRACLEAKEWLAPETSPEFELGGGGEVGATNSSSSSTAGATRFTAAAARVRRAAALAGEEGGGGAAAAAHCPFSPPPLHGERVWVHVAPGSLAGATDPISLKMVSQALGAAIAHSPREATLCVVAGGGAPPEALAPGAAAVGDEWLLLTAERWERPSRV